MKKVKSLKLIKVNVISIQKVIFYKYLITQNGMYIVKVKPTFS